MEYAGFGQEDIAIQIDGQVKDVLHQAPDVDHHRIIRPEDEFRAYRDTGYRGEGRAGGLKQVVAELTEDSANILRSREIVRLLEHQLDRRGSRWGR